MSAWRNGLLECCIKVLEKAMNKRFANLYEPCIIVAKVMVQFKTQLVLALLWPRRLSYQIEDHYPVDHNGWHVNLKSRKFFLIWSYLYTVIKCSWCYWPLIAQKLRRSNNSFSFNHGSDDDSFSFCSLSLLWYPILKEIFFVVLCVRCKT